MSIQKEMQHDVLILKIEGELMGGPETAAIQRRIYEAIEDENIQIVLDMASVKWMNSAGLGILMASMTTLRGSEGDLRLANCTERVRRPIQITKLDSVIRIFDSLDEAVNSFDREAAS